jgi:hypothetical protein
MMNYEFGVRIRIKITMSRLGAAEGARYESNTGAAKYEVLVAPDILRDSYFNSYPPRPTVAHPDGHCRRRVKFELGGVRGDGCNRGERLAEQTTTVPEMG